MSQSRGAPAPSSSAVPSRRGNLTPTNGAKRATLSSSPLPAAAASVAATPVASHASAAFAATQPLFQDESKQQQQQHYQPPLTSPQRITGKLETLAQRFDGFEDELNLSRSKKRAEEDKRILILQTQLNNLQASLALESKNRSMSVKALQNWLTDRIAQWTEQIEAPMSARLSALSEQITYLVGRIDGLEAKQQQDRERFPKLVDGRCADLMGEIANLRARFSENVAAREEKEKRLLLKVQSESNKAAVQFAQDKAMADEKVAQLRVAIDEEVAIRIRAHEMVQRTLHEELAAMRDEAARERAERTEADDSIVQAISHYSSSLQDGLKIVGSQ